MNSTIYPRSHRGETATAVAKLGGVLVAVALLSACGRRPIIVQAAPQPPAPTATIIHTPAPVSAPAPQPVVGTVTRDVIVVKEAPPPPREEAPPPPPPSSSYTWVPGYWSIRDGGRQEWVAGRYEMPPRTGATWVAPRWERRSDGYVFVDGYWR